MVHVSSARSAMMPMTLSSIVRQMVGMLHRPTTLIRTLALCLSVFVPLSIHGADKPMPPLTRPVLSLRSVPELCELIRVPKSSPMLELASPSQFWPSYALNLEGIIYSIGVDTGISLPEGDNRVRYVATSTPEFRTPEGVGVGFTVQQLKSVTSAKPRCETGWACFVPLPSGWNAASTLR